MGILQFIFVFSLLQFFGTDQQTGNANRVWQAIGGVGISGGAADHHSIAIDDDNRAWIAFRDLDEDRKTTVLRWSGESWIEVGGRGISDGPASGQKIIFSSDGTAWIVYRDLENGSRTTVRRWTGDEWEAVGGTGISDGAASYQSIVADINGSIWVAYRDWENESKTTVMMWDGESWSIAGRKGLSDGISEFQTLAAGEDGSIWLAYKDFSNFGKARVLKWNAEKSDWDDTGDSVTEDRARHLTLTVDHQGNPWLAYEDYDSGRRTTVQKFNRSEGRWQRVGKKGISVARSWHQNLKFSPDGTPWILFLDGGEWDGPEQWKPTVMNWNGFEWREVGGRGISRMGASSPSMDIDSYGVPWIVYRDEYNFDRTTVRRWQLFDESAPGEDETREELPVITSLLQNYPNPFNPSTEIIYELPRQSMVSLDVYTLDGKHIINLQDGSLERGVHRARFDGSGLASGVFLYKLVVNGEIVRIRTMTLIK
jgi:hypothetical protein